ncbi:hypothetical protein RI367_004420 [Sorochytrium milnesiophthora]
MSTLQRVLLVLLLCLARVTCGAGLRFMPTYVDAMAYPGTNVQVDNATVLNYTLISHLLYGPFGVFPDNGTVNPNDIFASEQMSFDTEDAFCYCCMRGNNGQVWKLKRRYPHLHTVMVIGPSQTFTNGTNFTDTTLANWTSTPAQRDTLSQSIVQYMLYSGFDGIDIDWNFTATQAAQLQPFLQSIRAELSALTHPQTPLHNYTLSVHLPARYSTLSQLNISSVAATVDLLHIKAYGMQGSDGLFRHSTSIRDNSQDPDPHRAYNSIEGLLNLLSQPPNSVPLRQVVVSLGFQGLVAYSLNTTGSGSPIFATKTTAPEIAQYKSWIYNLTTTQAVNWTRVVDAAAGGVSYWKHNVYSHAVSLPDISTLRNALSFLSSTGIYGVDFYTLALDTLNDTQNSGWHAVQDLALAFTEPTASASVYPRDISLCVPSSPFCNIRCNAYCYQYHPFHACQQPNTTALTYYVGGQDSEFNNPVRNALLDRGADGLATYFFVSDGPLGMTNPQTVLSMNKAFRLGHTVGLHINNDPNFPFAQMSDSDFQTYIASGLSKLSRVLNRYPHIIRIGFDDQQPQNDRLCRVLGQMNVNMASWSIDTFDWAYQNPANFSLIPVRYNQTIYNATVYNTSTSFISIQIDGAPSTFAAWDPIRAVNHNWGLSAINLEQCVNGTRTTYTAPVASQDQNPGCTVDQIAGTCVGQNALLMTFTGQLGSTQFYALSENLRLRGINYAVFYDASQLRTADAHAQSIAIATLQKLHRDNQVIGLVLLDGTPAQLVRTRLSIDADTVQYAIGARPRYVRIQTSAGDMGSFDPDVCAQVQQAGFQLVYGNVGAPLFDTINQLRLIDKLAPYTSSFISTQLIQYIPGNIAITASPTSGDWVDTWQSSLAARNIQLVSFDTCIGGPGASLTHYNAALYTCGDGRCYTFAEDCNNCPADCSCSTPTSSAVPTATSTVAQNNSTASSQESSGVQAFVQMLISPSGIVITVSIALCIVLGLAYCMFRNFQRAKNAVLGSRPRGSEPVKSSDTVN